MDLKYVTNTQIIEAQYEGYTRQFAVTSIHPTRTESPDHLVDNLRTLSLDPSSRPEVWTVGWDTVLRMAESQPGAEKDTIHKVHLRDLALSIECNLMVLLNFASSPRSKLSHRQGTMPTNQ